MEEAEMMAETRPRRPRRPPLTEAVARGLFECAEMGLVFAESQGPDAAVDIKKAICWVRRMRKWRDERKAATP